MNFQGLKIKNALLKLCCVDLINKIFYLCRATFFKKTTEKFIFGQIFSRSLRFNKKKKTMANFGTKNYIK